MDERDFELLEILKETRNITKAAERLFLTQSALSKRIAAIEGELGVSLMLRSRQGIRFTPAGECVLERAALAAHELELLRQELDGLSGEVCGTLNAGISINYAQFCLPDILAAYHTQYPRVRLQITTGSSHVLYRSMLDGSLDIAVLRGEYSWDAKQFLLSQECICRVCSRILQDKPLSELLYISHHTDTVQSAMLMRWMHENNIVPQSSGFCVDNVTTCLEMVKRGLGWALLPEIALKGFDGVIEPCRFENGEPLTRRTHILCQKEAMQLPQVDAFVNMLRQNS